MENHHPDKTLDWQRSEAHDKFLDALRAAGIPFTDRADGGRIASEIVAGAFDAGTGTGSELINGSGAGKSIDAAFLAMLRRHYTVEMVRGWVARADAGMRTKPGQVERWRKTLAWLEQEQVSNG